MTLLNRDDLTLLMGELSILINFIYKITHIYFQTLASSLSLFQSKSTALSLSLD